MITGPWTSQFGSGVYLSLTMSHMSWYDYTSILTSSKSWGTLACSVAENEYPYSTFDCKPSATLAPSLQWRHNGCDDVSNHQHHDCLLSRLTRRRSKKTPKLRVNGLCEGNSPVNFPQRWPVTRKMFTFDDVIMFVCCVPHHCGIRFRHQIEFACWAPSTNMD